ncbi:hypothetical protein Cantr_05956 [Candida viswanathii]|uniref:Uncharacterized protein n=1 Tax=Candida viswanathii TaxID=5486 RepID=A0A367XQ22_9ASCO|nr:hypothetical protein Cantr_05956 [Candida viswanathii]
MSLPHKSRADVIAETHVVVSNAIVAESSAANSVSIQEFQSAPRLFLCEGRPGSLIVAISVSFDSTTTGDISNCVEEDFTSSLDTLYRINAIDAANVMGFPLPQHLLPLIQRCSKFDFQIYHNLHDKAGPITTTTTTVGIAVNIQSKECFRLM